MNQQDKRAVQRIGVVGVGAMGQGIVQVAAMAGLQVVMYDQQGEALERALAGIAQSLQAAVTRNKINEGQRQTALSLITCANDFQDLADCEVVVEAIIEDLQIKQALLQALEQVVQPSTILASNTSSLSVTALQAVCRVPGRVAGWHFFNPVPLMRVAEVIEGQMTAPATATELVELTRRFGHTPIRAQDMPGFVVNHVGRALIPEGLRLLSEGVADFHVIDSVMKEVAGFRMGPFELVDLVGLDVAERVMESLYHQYFQEPRFRITPLVSRRVAAGLLGRKSQQGFYDYREGKQQPGSCSQIDRLPLNECPAVWVDPAEPDLADRVRRGLASSGVTLEEGPQPSSHALIVVTPVGKDTSTCCVERGLDPQRTVAVDALFALDKRIALMCCPATRDDYRRYACTVFAAGGAQVSLLHDTPGFIAQRIVAQIVSIGCDMAQQGIATPTEIDLAATLALGYPMGPFAFGDHLGPKRVLAISEALFAAYNDPRYRPSIWLRRRAALDLSLFQPD